MTPAACVMRGLEVRKSHDELLFSEMGSMMEEMEAGVQRGFKGEERMMDKTRRDIEGGQVKSGLRRWCINREWGIDGS